MSYALIADLIALLHFGYVLFVVVGQLAVIVGVWRGWQWVSNIWFRVTHLLAILVVAIETFYSIQCVLFTWENQYRALAGQVATGDSFISRVVYLLVLWSVPQWVFDILNVGFAALVLGTFVLAPPRWPPHPTLSPCGRGRG